MRCTGPRLVRRISDLPNNRLFTVSLRLNSNVIISDSLSHFIFEFGHNHRLTQWHTLQNTWLIGYTLHHWRLHHWSLLWILKRLAHFLFNQFLDLLLNRLGQLIFLRFISVGILLQPSFTLIQHTHILLISYLRVQLLRHNACMQECWCFHQCVCVSIWQIFFLANYVKITFTVLIEHVYVFPLYQLFTSLVLLGGLIV